MVNNFQEIAQRMMKEAKKTGQINSTDKHSSSLSKVKCQKCDDTGFITFEENGNIVAKECDCLEDQILNEKLEFATIKDKFKGTKIANYKTSHDYYNKAQSIKSAKMCKKAANEYVNRFEELKERGQGLYFHSKVAGSGKTMLISAIGNELINKYKAQVKFATAGDLLDAIRKTYKTNIPTHELIDAAKEVEVLILDDMGQQTVRSDTNDHLFKIFNHRMDKPVVTIFSSNCKIEDLPYNYRINSRIKDMAAPIHAPEESARENIADKKNEKVLKELIVG